MVYNQCRIFCIFFILGILTGFIFDFFRALRKSFKTKNVITYIEDIVFFVLIGCLYLKSIIVFSQGEIRFYIFVGAIFGIIIYFLTIGNLCAIIFKVILDFLKKFVLFFIQIIKIPVRIVNKIIQKSRKIIKVKNNM